MSTKRQHTTKFHSLELVTRRSDSRIFSAYHRRRRGGGLVWGLGLALPLLAPREATADAVLTPNQISGELEITAPNASISAVLQAQPISYTWIQAMSIVLRDGRHPP